MVAGGKAQPEAKHQGTFRSKAGSLGAMNVQGQGKVKTAGPLYEGQQYGIAFAKGSQWVEPANEALKAMHEDGTYDKIHEKWFGAAPDAK